MRRRAPPRSLARAVVRKRNSVRLTDLPLSCAVATYAEGAADEARCARGASAPGQPTARRQLQRQVGRCRAVTPLHNQRASGDSVANIAALRMPKGSARAGMRSCNLSTRVKRALGRVRGAQWLRRHGGGARRHGARETSRSELRGHAAVFSYAVAPRAGEGGATPAPRGQPQNNYACLMNNACIRPTLCPLRRGEAPVPQRQAAHRLPQLTSRRRAASASGVTPCISGEKRGFSPGPANGPPSPAVGSWAALFWLNTTPSVPRDIVASGERQIEVSPELFLMHRGNNTRVTGKKRRRCHVVLRKQN